MRTVFVDKILDADDEDDETEKYQSTKVMRLEDKKSTKKKCNNNDETHWHL